MEEQNDPERPLSSSPLQAIEVTVEAGQVDLVSGLLWTASVAAVAEHLVDDDMVILRTDVPPGGVAAVADALAGIAASEAIRVVEVLDDGLDAWRAHAEIIEVGRRLLVRPPWLPWEGPDDDHDEELIVIELDPGRSWGHGAHPTTRLCLVEIERMLDAANAEKREVTVVDVGCGSGVLSVAAALLGAARVEAFDLDPEAVKATTENARRNGVADRVQVHRVEPGHSLTPLDALNAPADVIVANIGAATLVDLAPHLLAHLAPTGKLVLSGLLDPPPPEVTAAYAPRVLTITTLAGWSALTL